MRLIFSILSLSLCLSAPAQTNGVTVKKLSLEDCIQAALEHNLQLKINRLDPAIASYTLSATYGRYDPALSFRARHSYDLSPGGVDPEGRLYPGTETESDSFGADLSGILPWGLNYTLGGTTSDRYGTRAFLPFESASGDVGFLELRQPLLNGFWIDSTRLQILLNRSDLKASELDLRQQVMTTVTRVEEAYYNLVFAQENIKVQETALELAERLLAENRKRVEVGALAPLDEKQAEAQAAGNRAELIAARGTEDTLQRLLKVLLSDDYSKWDRVRIKPADPIVALPQRFDLQESWRNGLSRRPDLEQQRVALERQGYIIRYQKNQVFPSLDVVGTYGYSGEGDEFSRAFDQIGRGDYPFWSYGAQLTMPLNRTTARNNLRGAKATREQIALQLKQFEQNVLIEIENAIANANTSFQRAGATRETRVFAQAALDAEQKKLQSGKSTSFEVLRLQRDLTTARSQEIRALADYNIDLARVAFNEGTTLERRNVSMEIAGSGKAGK
jgi:outer membrane protein TolC